MAVLNLVFYLQNDYYNQQTFVSTRAPMVLKTFSVLTVWPEKQVNHLQSPTQLGQYFQSDLNHVPKVMNMGNAGDITMNWQAITWKQTQLS